MKKKSVAKRLNKGRTVFHMFPHQFNEMCDFLALILHYFALWTVIKKLTCAIRTVPECGKQGKFVNVLSVACSKFYHLS